MQSTALDRLEAQHRAESMRWLLSIGFDDEQAARASVDFAHALRTGIEQAVTRFVFEMSFASQKVKGISAGS
jgi:hypothetical protein